MDPFPTILLPKARQTHIIRTWAQLLSGLLAYFFSDPTNPIGRRAGSGGCGASNLRSMERIAGSSVVLPYLGFDRVHFF